MMMYDFEIEFLAKTEDKNDTTNRRERVTEIELLKLKEKHPKVSNEYLAYLREIGSGTFRECQFKVHRFLFDLEDLGLSEAFDLSEEIHFFGDNFSGDFSGFDFSANPEFVVEFLHESGRILETKKNFKEYMQEKMLIGLKD